MRWWPLAPVIVALALVLPSTASAITYHCPESNLRAGKDTITYERLQITLSSTGELLRSIEHRSGRQTHEAVCVTALGVAEEASNPEGTQESFSNNLGRYRCTVRPEEETPDINSEHFACAVHGRDANTVAFWSRQGY